MGCAHLILSVSPPFPHIEHDWDISQWDGVDFIGNLFKAVVRDEVSITLIQPEIVPPFHSHVVSKPMVSHFVSHSVGELSVGSRWLLLSEDVNVVEGDASRVLHGTPIVFRNKNGIVFSELVGHSKELLIKLHALSSDLEYEVLEILH